MTGPAALIVAAVLLFIGLAAIPEPAEADWGEAEIVEDSCWWIEIRTQTDEINPPETLTIFWKSPIRQDPLAWIEIGRPKIQPWPGNRVAIEWTDSRGTRRRVVGYYAATSFRRLADFPGDDHGFSADWWDYYGGPGLSKPARRAVTR